MNIEIYRHLSDSEKLFADQLNEIIMLLKGLNRAIEIDIEESMNH